MRRREVVVLLGAAALTRSAAAQDARKAYHSPLASPRNHACPPGLDGQKAAFWVPISLLAAFSQALPAHPGGACCL
jgi:hypothetical protein